MTQCQAKIKGPVVNILSRVIVEHGGLWEIRISATLPATHAGMELPLTVIGRRASVGGSAGPSDWPCVLGPADGPPGGMYKAYRGTGTVNCCSDSDRVTEISKVIKQPRHR